MTDVIVKVDSLCLNLLKCMSKVFRFTISYIVIALLLCCLGFITRGCGYLVKTDTKPIEVNFADSNSGSSRFMREPSSILYVAISSMVSPQETFKLYEELIRYISDKLQKPIEFKQRRTYEEVNQLVKSGQVDFAFICSGAYVELTDNFPVEILAVPVCYGKTSYQSYIIVNKFSRINKFEDLKGSSFAFTDPLSNTGRLYPVKRVYDTGFSLNDFFQKPVYTYAHDYSIQLVEKGTVDAAAVDGLVYEYIAKFSPESVKNIRTIEKSEYYGTPPVVAPAFVPRETKEGIRKVLLDAYRDPVGKKILDKLLIDRFTEGKDSDYDGVRKLKSLLRK